MHGSGLGQTGVEYLAFLNCRRSISIKSIVDFYNQVLTWGQQTTNFRLYSIIVTSLTVTVLSNNLLCCSCVTSAKCALQKYPQMTRACVQAKIWGWVGLQGPYDGQTGHLEYGCGFCLYRFCSQADSSRWVHISHRMCSGIADMLRVSPGVCGGVDIWSRCLAP